MFALVHLPCFVSADRATCAEFCCANLKAAPHTLEQIQMLLLVGQCLLCLCSTGSLQSVHTTFCSRQLLHAVLLAYRMSTTFVCLAESVAFNIGLSTCVQRSISVAMWVRCEVWAAAAYAFVPSVFETACDICYYPAVICSPSCMLQD